MKRLLLLVLMVLLMMVFVACTETNQPAANAPADKAEETVDEEPEVITDEPQEEMDSEFGFEYTLTKYDAIEFLGPHDMVMHYNVKTEEDISPEQARELADYFEKDIEYNEVDGGLHKFWVYFYIPSVKYEAYLVQYNGDGFYRLQDLRNKGQNNNE